MCDLLSIQGIQTSCPSIRVLLFLITLLFACCRTCVLCWCSSPASPICTFLCWAGVSSPTTSWSGTVHHSSTLLLYFSLLQGRGRGGWNYPLALQDKLWSAVKIRSGQDIILQVKFWFTVHITCHCNIFQEDAEKIVEWAAKAEFRKVEFLAVGEVCKAICLPSPDVKERTFGSCRFSAEGTFVPMFAVLHSGR